MISAEANPICRQDPRVRSVIDSMDLFCAGFLPSLDHVSRLNREPDVWLLSAIYSAAAYFAFDEHIERMFMSGNLPGRSRAFTPFASNNVQGCIVASDRVAVLAIAGSNDGWDWAQNAKVNLTYSAGNPSRGMHSGFVDHATAACEAASRTRLLTGRQVLIVGHSLGGAAAMAATQFLAKFASIDRVIGCVTFGCPRVGNAAEVAHIASTQPLVQLWNVGDPVPHLPFYGCVNGYRHPSKVQRYLSADGNLYRTRRAVWVDIALASLRSVGLLRKPWEIGSPAQAHSIIEYIARLATYLGDPAYV